MSIMIRALFTDIHWGKSNDSEEHNANCMAFVDWFITEAKSAKADRICFLGDWHDVRNRIGVETLNWSTRALEALDASGIPVDIIIGNHDMPYKNSRKNHSLPWAPRFTNVRVIDEPLREGDTLHLPYLVPGDDISEIVKMAANSETVIGHLELGGFLMNGSFEMPEVSGHLSASMLRCKQALSGHFHKRQTKINSHGTRVTYIGNCFPHDFSDEGDDERGMALVDGSKDPVYIRWPGAPSFKRVKLSEFDPVSIAPGARIRIVQDTDIGKKDRDMLAEAATECGIKLTFDPAPPPELTAADWKQGQSMDEFVAAWLGDVTNLPEGLDPATLIRMYADVPGGRK